MFVSSCFEERRMAISPLAGKRAPDEILIDVDKLRDQ